MKISTNSAAAVLLTGAFLATSCANDVETSVNTDPQGNAISFTASVGRSSRATEIKLDNLGDFAVVAKGIHPEGTLYNSYLIGDANGGEIAHFKDLTGSGKDQYGTWTLDRSVYWPTSLDRVLFIGYTTLKRGADNKSENSEGGVLGDATFSITSDKPTIANFKPLKCALTANDADNSDEIWADGEGQKDLLVAFKDMVRGSNTTVKLQFRHALTQLSVTASQGDLDANDDHRIVKVKGAWIVNAAESGTLSATIESKKVDNKITVTNKTTWTPSGTATYGTYYDGIRELNGTTTTDILSKSLMLVPQSLTKWNKSETDKGAYIMLLCRIELKHSGATHTGSDITDIAIEGNNHYHQLFPVNATYDGSQYGFVCVPIDTDWADASTDTNAPDCKGAGKHYTYNLDICGKNSGAGIYPPTPEKDKLIPSGATVEALVLKDGNYEKQTVTLSVVDRPSGKNVGDAVLDDPIMFSVTVADWTDDSGEWKDGTESNASED
ncbi:MAG: fimbrillin family protein [Muribaculaceae bacterium]|nr:fimbrillin family protein [Muribaculaceae bacterium]